MRTRTCTRSSERWAVPGFVVTVVLLAASPVVADEPKPDGPESEAIIAKLGERIGFGFKEQTPLWDVVNYASKASQGPNDKGIPFDFDDNGLKKVGKTMHSPIPVAIDGVIPIKDGLHKALEPMGLTYSVKKGVLVIGPDPKGKKG